MSERVTGIRERASGPDEASLRSRLVADDMEAARLAALFWDRLAHAVADRASAWRTPALATVTPQGRPAVRTIVLRHVDKAERELLFFTDSRSPKLKDFAHRAEAELCFYDPTVNLQVRASGPLGLADLAFRRRVWEQTPLASRRAYLIHQAPGADLSGPGSGLPKEIEGRVPDAEEIEAGFQHFDVIRFEVREIDILELHRAGDRRARLTRALPRDRPVPDKKLTKWQMTWVQP